MYKYFFAIACFLFFSIESNVFAQKKMKCAEVYYSLSYKGVDADIMSDMPKQAIILVSGNNTRKTVSISETKTCIIANRDSSFLANMTSSEDAKVAILCDSLDVLSAKATLDFKIERKKGEKNILGYKCQEYYVVITDKLTGEKVTEEIFATEDIGGLDVNFYLYDQIKGFILYSKKTDGKEVVVTEAKRIVKKSSIASSYFQIPKEYEIQKCEK